MFGYFSDIDFDGVIEGGVGRVVGGRLEISGFVLDRVFFLGILLRF